MRLRTSVVAFTLMLASALVALAGGLPLGIPSANNLRNVEASNYEARPDFRQSVPNQQAISDAIAAHGADKWHAAGFKGEGVKIGVIDRGFAGIQELMGTGLPEPVGVRCYYLVTDPTITDNFTEDLSDCLHEELGTGAVGAAVLEAVHDIAPDAEYYIASISQDSFYHFDLAGIVEWMNGEGVDLILFTHDGGWSGPGDGTSIYAASELATLDRAVSYGITWLSPTGDRAEDTWSGFFTDTNSNGFHEFAPGVECNGVDLDEPNSAFAAQIRWNDPWLTATRDLEVDLINEETGDTEAISDRHDNLRGDPNELLVFETPDTPSTYCLRIELKSESNSPLIFNLQSYNGHSLDHPSIYGSVTSPAESVNLGMLAVGAAAWDNDTEIRPFSGRGPMNNRTTKPDIVGADGAYSQVLGRNWQSTAQAAAHVAGLSALVKQRFPSYTPQQIADYLRDNADSRPAEVGDLNQSGDLNNTWGHGFATLPDDVDVTPPSQVDALEATKAYVDEAIRRYREDSEAALAYYRSEESINKELGMYLLLLDDGVVVLNPVSRSYEGINIEGVTDPKGNEYGKALVGADEDGVEVKYLATDPTNLDDNFTFRNKTDWAKLADGLVFSAGWIDRDTDVESTLSKSEKATATVMEARDRIAARGIRPTVEYYKTPASIDGEFYIIMANPLGPIVADATGHLTLGTNIRDIQASDDPELGQKLFALEKGSRLETTHLWPNPAKEGREERRHTYAVRLSVGIYLISGYYEDTPDITPPPELDPLDAAKAYVNKAIEHYRDDSRGAREFYSSGESIDEELGLYLLLLRDGVILVNPAFPASVNTSVTWRTDPLERTYGKALAEADEDGLVVEYLVPVRSDNFTFRKKTAWAIHADGLVFSAGWIDRETDVESDLTPREKAIGTVIEARGRLQSVGLVTTIEHYKKPESRDGEYYAILARENGNIIADATGHLTLGTNIADIEASDDPDLGKKIFAVDSAEGEWFTHMWPNPETGQEERRQTYVTRFFGLYIVSGYYGEAPPVVDPRAAAKAYVEEAIRAYREDPEAAKEYYQSEASVDRETDLYLILLDGTEIIVNGGFSGVVGDDITSRIGIDAIGKEYGKELAAADENGTFVDYLIPDPLHDYTLYRKHTWAIKADGLIFAAGSWDKTEDVESTLEPHQDVIAAIYKAGARLLAFGGDQAAFGRLVQYYNTPASIDGERYVFLVAPNGIIVADATRLDLLRTNIADLQASDDSELGQKIAAVQEGEELWLSHMWQNPATGRAELKHTYVTRFRGIIFGSGYYGDAPPPVPVDPCIMMIDVPTTKMGTWDASCLSENRPSGEGGQAGANYYARFYTFTLDQASDVTISLTSSEDTVLYLMEGEGKGGTIVADNDDVSSGDRNSRIEDQSLGTGTYTIEATTYDAEATGDFTLTVELDVTVEPPPVDVKYIAISSGANHVCAIATDGSIMCWGDDSQGQVSERPTSGRFTEISSGDNHTCALRDDGAVICWGSFDVP